MKMQQPPRRAPVSMRLPGTRSSMTFCANSRTFFRRSKLTMLCAGDCLSRPGKRGAPEKLPSTHRSFGGGP